MIDLIMEFLTYIKTESVQISFARDLNQYRIMLAWIPPDGRLPEVVHMDISEEHLRTEPDKALAALKDIYKKHKIKPREPEIVSVSPVVGNC